MRCIAVAVVAIAACEQRAPAPAKPARKDAGAAVAISRPPYCADARPWPTGARTCSRDEDCAPDGRCYPDGVPDYSSSCGVEPREVTTCTDDRSCGRHAYCDHTPEARGCEEVIEAQCRPRCTASSCAAGEVCGRSGRCGPRACSQGHACPAGWTCDPGGQVHDEHGCRQPACTATSCAPNQRCTGELCEPKPCTSMADCDCGACIDGTCHARPGICGPRELSSPP